MGNAVRRGAYGGSVGVQRAVLGEGGGGASAEGKYPGTVLGEEVGKILILCWQVNIKGKHGRTPLYLAAEEGHVYIVKCLLQHPDIDLNSK